MKQLPTVIYLHGLGSSPQSPKARLFAEHFTALGHEVVVPELSQPSLQQLSVHSALKRVEEVLLDVCSRGTAIVIGSSFGGFLAVNALRCAAPSVRSEVKGLVLLAPVLYPRHPREPIITQKMEDEWRNAGAFPIAEGATGQNVPVHFGFLDQLNEYAEYEPKTALPTLVVHGVRDEAVPYAHSVEFVEQNSAARLVTLQDDHQLMAAPQTLVTIAYDFAEELRRGGHL